MKLIKGKGWYWPVLSESGHLVGTETNPYHCARATPKLYHLRAPRNLAQRAEFSSEPAGVFR